MTSYETIIKLIGSTKTKKGLRIEATLDERDYEKGMKILDDNMTCLKIIFMSYILIGIIQLSRVQTCQDQELLGNLFIVNP